MANPEQWVEAVPGTWMCKEDGGRERVRECQAWRVKLVERLSATLLVPLPLGNGTDRNGLDVAKGG